MVIKFVCEYSGKGFHGFQKQGKKKSPDSYSVSHKELRTVQSVIEEALSKFFGKEIKIVGSGRTDAGVHAKGQVCSFQIENISKHPNYMFKVATAINAFLPQDVSVRDFEITDDNFHAQFSAKAKTYIYKCYISQYRSVLRTDTHLQIYKMPDIEKMVIASKNFIGTQNYKEFTTDKTDTNDFIRTIYSFEVKHLPNDSEIHFVIRGSGFMRNMVRILCGRILDIGLGVSQQRTTTLPAHGLILESVEY